VLYVLVLLVVLLFLLIGTTSQAMADPNNWISLAFWGIIFIVVAIFFVRTLMKKPQPKLTSVQAPAAN
jgi:di/tricarboxylate transporter